MFVKFNFFVFSKSLLTKPFTYWTVFVFLIRYSWVKMILFLESLLVYLFYIVAIVIDLPDLAFYIKLVVVVNFWIVSYEIVFRIKRLFSNTFIMDIFLLWFAMLALVAIMMVLIKFILYLYTRTRNCMLCFKISCIHYLKFKYNLIRKILLNTIINYK